jgi:hypothetical protein
VNGQSSPRQPAYPPASGNAAEGARRRGSW